MSAAAGSLVVSLGLDAAEYTRGLTKSEYQARRFGENIGNLIRQGTTIAIGSLSALGVAGTAAFAALNQQAEKIANYQDFADRVGDTAEAFASLKLASDISGKSLDTIAVASQRLTSTLSKTDDESKLVGQAIKALGLEFESFKSLSPVEQLDAVAKAMSGFAAGSEKTAVSMALFGKAGADLIPFFNDLADGAERQISLTAEQIAQADEYTKATARLRSEFDTFVQRQAADAIPTLSAVQAAIAEIVKNETVMSVATGVLNAAMRAAIVVFQAITVVATDVGFVFLSVGREIGAWAAQIAAIARGDLKGFRAISDAVREDGIRARAELDKFQARIMAIGQPGALTGARLDARSDPRSLGVGESSLPRLAFNPSLTKPKAEKDPYAEAKRYLESLQQQYERTLDLSAVERVLKDLQLDRIGAVTAAQREQMLGIARQIDAAKALEEQMEIGRAAAIEQGEAVERANEAYQSQLRAILDTGPQAQLERQRQAMLLLAEAFEAGRISAEQFNDAATGFLNLTAETEKTKSLAEDLGLTFSSAFEDAIVGGRGLSDVLKGLEQDIIRIVTRKLVTEPLGNSLTDFLKPVARGSGGGLGGVFSGIFSKIGGFLGFDGGGYTGAGARSGGLDGKGGFMAMVHPNETIIDHSRGQTLRAGGGGTVVNLTVTPPAGSNRSTATQWGAQVGRQIDMAMRRNG